MKQGLAAVASVSLPMPALSAPLLVNDITRLNPVRVDEIYRPRTTEDVRYAISSWSAARPFSIAGGRYSMGGQTAQDGSRNLDMRGLNRVVHLDPARRIVRVQTGMTWRALQSVIDPLGLSVKIMQSYANFTIGGSLSVNAHGRYVGLGPLINSVRAIQMILPDGSQIDASRTQNAELFRGAIGGYGGLGVITEAELDLVPNVRMERNVARLSVAEYPDFFRKQVQAAGAILHNADIDPGLPGQLLAVTWFETGKQPTIARRLIPQDENYAAESTQLWALAEIPGAHALRRAIADPLIYARPMVVWRNHEASLDVASLGPIATDSSTFALQEYFIPVAGFADFAAVMSKILRDSRVNALNISVRHAPADYLSLMSWARSDVFSFVLYYKQRSSLDAQRQVGEWTRRLIDAALGLGGTFYLPYQLHATPAQFARAYPNAANFFALKAQIDSANRFRNKLWDKYSSA